MNVKYIIYLKTNILSMNVNYIIYGSSNFMDVLIFGSSTDTNHPHKVQFEKCVYTHHAKLDNNKNSLSLTFQSGLIRVWTGKQ